MKLVMTMLVHDDADLLDAQIAFHLNVGVDIVVAADRGSTDGSGDVLESYVRAGYVRQAPTTADADDSATRATLARLALDEHDADWLIDSEPAEFWLPRAESITDVLVAIPPRYGVVQGLVRTFLPRPDDGTFFAERMTVRRALMDVRDDESMGDLERALRPIQRASENLVIAGSRDAVLDGRVPLRAWYPVEVLRFPVRSSDQAERHARSSAARSRIEERVAEAHRHGTLLESWDDLVADDAEVARGVADGSLVVDERLRDALRHLKLVESPDGPERGFAVPQDGVGQLALGAPSVVDDVAYAGECAAVREVDFEPLQDRISELEQRIAALEAGFWPRVARTLSRIVRR